MAQSPEYHIRFFENRDEAEVIDLVTSTFSSMSKDLWLWKYLRNPDFERSLVFVAENSNGVIGCIHYLPREFKIAGSLKVKAALGADLAVHPDYRQHGIGSSMLRFSRSSKALEQRGVMVTYGFVDYQRAGFYRRNINSVIVPPSTTMYQKFLDVSPIEKRFAFLSTLTQTDSKLWGELKGVNMDVLFRLTGVPLFILKVKDGKISVDREQTPNPEIVVEGDPYLLESFYDGRRGSFDLFLGILKGRIRVMGGVWKMLKFYGVVKTIRRLISSESRN